MEGYVHTTEKSKGKLRFGMTPLGLIHFLVLFQTNCYNNAQEMNVKLSNHVDVESNQ